MGSHEARVQPLSIRTNRRGGCGEAEAEQPLSPSARLFHEPQFNCYIVAVLGIGTPSFDLAAVRAGLESTFLRHPRFSSVQVVEGSSGRWVRTEVDLDRHIVVPDLDVGPDCHASAGDRLVEDYVSGLSRDPHLDPTRPLWDLHLLAVRTSESAAVGILRVHHSLGDGASLMSLVLASARKAADPTALPDLPNLRRREPPPRAKPARFPWALLLSLWAALVLAWHTAVDVLVFAATAAFFKDSDTPLRGEDAVASSPKRFVHRTVSLGDVKDVKNAMRCTVNDVLVGVTSAGLSRYLRRKYESAGDTDGDGMKQKKNHLANIRRLRATLMVSVRPTPGVQALADMMKDRGEAKWGNWFAYVLLPFRIAIHEDPLEYVRQGKAIIDRKKNSLEGIFTYNLCSFVVNLFGVKVASALCYRVIRNTTFSFSNVIGPVEEITLYGHPVVYIAPSVYGHAHAVTFHFQSYADKMTIVLAVDERVIPDPHQLLDDLAISLELMKNAAKIIT